MLAGYAGPPKRTSALASFSRLMPITWTWQRLRAGADVVKTAMALVTDRNLTFIAGAIAYSAFLSLVPLLVLMLGIAALIRGEGVTAPLLATVEANISPLVADLLRSALSRKSGTLGASLIGLVVLIWSSLKVFRGLNVAFAAVYGETETSFVATLRDGVVAFVCLVAAIGALVGIEAALVLVVDRTVLELLGPALLFFGLFVAFLPVYYVLPDVHVTFQEVVPGALLAAGGWLALGVLFQLYVSVTGTAAGVLGGVILLLTWLYVAALLFLLGAVVNAVLGGKESQRPTAELTAVEEQ